MFGCVMLIHYFHFFPMFVERVERLTSEKVVALNIVYTSDENVQHAQYMIIIL